MERTNPFDHLHFACAGILTCFYVAFEICGLVVWDSSRSVSPTWVFFALVSLIIALSGLWSVRLIIKGKREAWLFLLGDCIYASVVIGVMLFLLRP